MLASNGYYSKGAGVLRDMPEKIKEWRSYFSRKNPGSYGRDTNITVSESTFSSSCSALASEVKSLRENELRFRLAFEGGDLGLWDWDIPSGKLTFNQRWVDHLGYDFDEIIASIKGWESLVHPDDVKSVLEVLTRHLEGKRPFYESEHRMLSKFGEWKWFHERGKVVEKDREGNPVRVAGTHRDITGRKEMEESMRRLSLVASRTNTGVIIADAEGRVEWVNYAFEKISGYELFDLQGKAPGELLEGSESEHTAIEQIVSAVNEGREFHAEVLNIHKSGRAYWMDIDATPIFDHRGNLIQFILIVIDITERKEAESAMLKAKEAAEAANRAKSDFLANMSHEIRTPMNAVVGMTSLLLDTSLSVEQRDFVETIRTSNEALLNIINDILDFSKIESGKLDLERVPFGLTICIEETLELFTAKAAEKNLELLYLIDSQVPDNLIGDPTRLRQILVNLVGNALKFTDEGEIFVTVASQSCGDSAAALKFSVRDTGIGIPEDRQTSLFDSFTQVDTSTTRRYGGTGLGLAICKRLCEMMNGEIEVKSEPGKGSEFLFRLTLDVDEGRSPATLVENVLKGKRALIVDDNRANRRILSHLVEKWGMLAVEAASGAEALSLFSDDETLAVVILDYHMPEMDGVTVAEKIRKSSRGRELPIVMLASIVDLKVLENRDPLNFSAFITKPIKQLILRDTLKRIFLPAEASLRSLRNSASPFAEFEAPRRPVRILLAEDNPVNQKVTLLLLKRLGYRADLAADGVEAVHALRRQPYEVVLMDMQMPEMDGIAATEEIRRLLPEKAQPHIIALTANATVEDRKACERAGMNAYISKPIRIETLASALKQVQAESIAGPA